MTAQNSETAPGGLGNRVSDENIRHSSARQILARDRREQNAPFCPTRSAELRSEIVRPGQGVAHRNKVFMGTA